MYIRGGLDGVSGITLCGVILGQEVVGGGDFLLDSFPRGYGYAEDAAVWGVRRWRWRWR